MLEGMYFWKDKNGAVSKLKLFLFLILSFVLIGGGGAGGWYYFVTLPAQKAKEEVIARQQQAAKKLKDDIDSVNKFYSSSLEGADIDQAVIVLNELKKSDDRISIAPLDSRMFNCDTKNCRFEYKMSPGAIWVLPHKVFWGKDYQPTLMVNNKKGGDKKKGDFSFDKIESRLNKNALIEAYKHKKPLPLSSCSDVVSYLVTYNSMVKGVGKESKAKKAGEIIIKTMPKTTVCELESQLSGKVKAYGLMAGKWELELKSDTSALGIDDLTNLQILLYKQAYRDAFLVKKIESQDKGMKISGDLVCKKG